MVSLVLNDNYGNMKDICGIIGGRDIDFSAESLKSRQSCNDVFGFFLRPDVVRLL